MNDEQIKQITLNAIGAVLAKMPTLEDRKNAMESLWKTSYGLVRKSNGDEFVHGWLVGTMQELNADQPANSTTPQLTKGSAIMKKTDELMREITRVLTRLCSCEVSIEDVQIIGIPNWCIFFVPGNVRESYRPVLWDDLVKEAQTKQQRPMLMHLLRGDWYCTSIHPLFDDWIDPGFNDAMTQAVEYWWQSHGEQIAFPDRHAAKEAALCGKHPIGKFWGSASV